LKLFNAVLLLAKLPLERESESFPPLPYPSWQLHQIKAWVRLDQVVIQHAHNERSSVTSTGLLIIGLTSLTNQLEDVQAEMLPYAMATRHIDTLSSKTRSEFNMQFPFLSLASIFADLGNRGHPAVQFLQNALISMQNSL